MPSFSYASRRRINRLGLAASCAALALAPATVAAQSVDADGALVVEQQAQSVLDLFAEGLPEADIFFDGEVEALPEGNSYAVAVPDLVFEVDDDFRGVLPAFDAQVTPMGGELLEVIWTFTSPFAANNPDGNESLTVTFDNADNRILAAPQYETALEVDIRLSDMELAVPSEGVTGGADLFYIGTNSDALDADAHLYAVESLIELSGLSVVHPTDGSFELGSLILAGESDRQRLDLFAAVSERMRGVDPDDEEENLQALAELLVTSADEAWIGDMTLGVAMTDLVFDIDDAAFSLGEFTTDIVANNLDAEAADLGIELSIADVASPELPEPMKPVIPTFAELALYANDAPLQAVLGEVRATLGTGEAEMGPKGRRMGTGVSYEALEDLDPMELLGILLTSDALVELRALRVEAPLGYLSGAGTMDPDPGAALQFTAQVDLRIAGLAEMIAFAQSMGSDIAEAAAFASVLSAMGRDATDEDGVAVKDFEIEVTAAGQVLLNGNDLSPILGAFQ
ncbi:MAG: hypothetical protein KI785_02285 [Devosiaceae bacterium]|nr:hypothetical protein [Devosiaceae bacterium MH13]